MFRPHEARSCRGTCVLAVPARWARFPAMSFQARAASWSAYTDATSGRIVPASSRRAILPSQSRIPAAGPRAARGRASTVSARAGPDIASAKTSNDVWRWHRSSRFALRRVAGYGLPFRRTSRSANAPRRAAPRPRRWPPTSSRAARTWSPSARWLWRTPISWRAFERVHPSTNPIRAPSTVGTRAVTRTTPRLVRPLTHQHNRRRRRRDEAKDRLNAPPRNDEADRPK